MATESDPKVGTVQRCPACNAWTETNASYVYINAGESRCNAPSIDKSYIARTCKVCGYVWTETPIYLVAPNAPVGKPVFFLEDVDIPALERRLRAIVRDELRR